jgi:hypothetical protein
MEINQNAFKVYNLLIVNGAARSICRRNSLNSLGSPEAAPGS